LALLSELSHKVRQVVIISGRDSSFLAERVPVDGLLLVGNHGLEQWQDGESRLLPEAQPYLDSLRRAASAIERLDAFRLPGIQLEPKRATLAVHFRRADESAAGRLREPLAQIARQQGLELRPGRMVFELRPPVEMDKGAILGRLVMELQPAGVLYAGDDLTDMDAFRSLRAMAGAGIQTCSVGVRSHEVPDKTFADCDLVVQGVSGLIELLSRVRAAVEA
jgi:trehalose 6-phosphate phosphatase